LGYREEDEVEQVIGTPTRARRSVGAGLGNALSYGAGAVFIASLVTMVFMPLGILCFLAVPIVMIRALNTRRGDCPRCDESLQFVSSTNVKCPRCKAQVFIKKNGELGVS
jgi:hypothetical protein